MAWTDTEVAVTEGGETFAVARPAYVVQGFGGAAINSAGELLFDRWLGWAGRPDPLYYLNASARRFRDLNPKTLTRVRTDLRKADTRPAFYVVKDTPGFDAGSAALEVSLGATDKDGVANLAHLALPVDHPAAVGADAAAAEFTRLVGEVPFRHATAGFGFNMVWGREWEQEAMPRVMAAGRRYLALDVRDRLLESRLTDHVKGPGWLTYLGPDLLAEVGGRKAVDALPKEVGREAVGEGVVLRAGKEPPVGDVNRRAKDLGPLRAVARFLQPIRAEAWVMADFFEIEEDDANAWFGRLDE